MACIPKNIPAHSINNPETVELTIGAVKAIMIKDKNCRTTKKYG